MQLRKAICADDPGGMRLNDINRLGLVLLLDVFQNALAVAMAVRILHARIRPVYICFAALFGAFAALAAEIARIPRGYMPLLWLPTALVMMSTAAGCTRKARRAIGRAALLLACEGFLGGVLLALYGATGSLAAAHALSIACAGAVFVSARRTADVCEDSYRIQVTCLIAQKRLSFDAIADSGNSLRDYLTHKPVIVAGNLLCHCAEDVRVRPIFADTAGGRQMMLLVMPNRTILSYGGKERQVNAALAFSPALKEDAPALVPLSLIR